jgi:hypothetical protein
MVSGNGNVDMTRLGALAAGAVIGYLYGSWRQAANMAALLALVRSQEIVNRVPPTFDEPEVIDEPGLCNVRTTTADGHAVCERPRPCPVHGPRAAYPRA